MVSASPMREIPVGTVSMLQIAAIAGRFWRGQFAWIASMKSFFVGLVLSFSGWCFAGDSTGNASPVMASNTAVQNAACSRAYEEAVTAAGKPLVCMGGVWRNVGMNGFEKVSYVYYRTAADNYKTLTHTKACPAGKRIIHTDCNFNGGTNQHGKPFIGAADDFTAVCFFTLFNAYDPAYPGQPQNSLVTTAYCVEDEP